MSLRSEIQTMIAARWVGCVLTSSLSEIVIDDIIKIAGALTVPRQVYDSLLENYQNYRKEAQDKIAKIPRLKERIARLENFESIMFTHTGEIGDAVTEAWRKSDMGGKIVRITDELAVKTGLIDDMEAFLEKIGHLDDWLEYQQAGRGEVEKNETMCGTEHTL